MSISDITTPVKVPKKKRTSNELKEHYQKKIAELEKDVEVRVKRTLIKLHHELQQMAVKSSGKPYAQAIAKLSSDVQGVANQIKVEVPQ